MRSIETPGFLMKLIEGKEVRSNGTDLTTRFQAPIAHMALDDMDTCCLRADGASSAIDH